MLTANDISVDKREHILRLYTERVNVLEIAGIVNLPVEVVAEVIQASKKHRERELLPRRGRAGSRAGVRVREFGLTISSAVMDNLNGHTNRCRILFDPARKFLTIRLDPDGPWSISRRGGAKVGGRLLVQELLDEGIQYGTYAAAVKDDDNTILVNLNRRIG